MKHLPGTGESQTFRRNSGTARRAVEGPAKAHTPEHQQQSPSRLREGLGVGSGAGQRPKVKPNPKKKNYAGAIGPHTLKTPV